MILFEHLYIYFYIENNVYTVKSKRREPDNPPPGNSREGREGPESQKKVPEPQKKSGKMEIQKNDYQNSEK